MNNMYIESENDFFFFYWQIFIEWCKRVERFRWNVMLNIHKILLHVRSYIFMWDIVSIEWAMGNRCWPSLYTCFKSMTTSTIHNWDQIPAKKKPKKMKMKLKYAWETKEPLPYIVHRPMFQQVLMTFFHNNHIFRS